MPMNKNAPPTNAGNSSLAVLQSWIIASSAVPKTVQNATYHATSFLRTYKYKKTVLPATHTR